MKIIWNIIEQCSWKYRADTNLLSLRIEEWELVPGKPFYLWEVALNGRNLHKYQRGKSQTMEQTIADSDLVGFKLMLKELDMEWVLD